MNAQTLMQISRVCAALFAAFAAVAVVTAVDSLSGFSYTSRVPLHSAPAILLFLAVFLLRAAYLAWFRWSPLAVRHIVGTFAFFLTIWLVALSPGFATLVAFPVCYVAYRFWSSRLARYAFPANTSAMPCSNDRNAS
jgi:hypothetical protein